MPRPFRLAPLAVWLFAVAGTAAAQVAESGATPSLPAAPVAPPAGPRRISARTMTMLRAATPQFSPAAAANAEAAKPTGALLTETDSDPSIVQLPRYVVTDDKLPRAEDVMTGKARAELAMNQYLGPKDGLDRGFLNRVTLPELWKKVPLLGQILPVPIPSVTNEQRALERYYEDERLRRMNDLSDLARMTSATGNRDLGEKIRRETRNAFRRDE